MGYVPKASAEQGLPEFKVLGALRGCQAPEPSRGMPRFRLWFGAVGTFNEHQCDEYANHMARWKLRSTQKSKETQRWGPGWGALRLSDADVLGRAPGPVSRGQAPAPLGCNPRRRRQRALRDRRCTRRGLVRPPPPRAADARTRARAARGCADVTSARAASLAALTSPPRPRAHAGGAPGQASRPTSWSPAKRGVWVGRGWGPHPGGPWLRGRGVQPQGRGCHSWARVWAHAFRRGVAPWLPNPRGCLRPSCLPSSIWGACGQHRGRTQT